MAVRYFVVDLEPAVEPRIMRVVGHRGVIGIAHSDETAGTQHPLRLDERRDRLGQMLEKLVGECGIE